MPEITPEAIPLTISVPVLSIFSGAQRSGRDLEYLFRDLNLVLHPGEMLPPL